MYLNQSPGATGYAYEEEEFAIDYSVGINGLNPGTTLGVRPYLVFGNFQTPGFAEFGPDVNYWWMPIIPGSTLPAGPPVLLGSLQYDDYISSLGGPFVNLVPDTFGSNFLNGVASPAYGFLELTGDMYLIGDPVSINVEAVPEPSSVAIIRVRDVRVWRCWDHGVRLARHSGVVFLARRERIMISTRIVLLAGVAACLVAGAAKADTMSAFGVQYTSLGGATLSSTATGGVQVSNIGSSGNDGVQLTPLATTAWANNFFIDTSMGFGAVPTGGYIEETTTVR